MKYIVRDKKTGKFFCAQAWDLYSIRYYIANGTVFSKEPTKATRFKDAEQATFGVCMLIQEKPMDYTCDQFEAIPILTPIILVEERKVNL